MIQPQKQDYTPEEYFAMEECAEYRSEYVYGEILAMSGGTPNHNRIVVNLISALNRASDGTSGEVFANDLRVQEEDGTWRLWEYTDMEETLIFRSIQVEVAIREMYRRVAVSSKPRLVRKPGKGEHLWE